MAYKQKVKDFQDAITIIGWMTRGFGGEEPKVFSGSERAWKPFDKALAEGTPTGQRGGLFLSELRRTYTVNGTPNPADLPPVPENALIVRVEEVQVAPIHFMVRVAYRKILGE